MTDPTGPPPLTFVIPSRGRAGRVPALRLFPSAWLAVRESEVDAYRAAHPDTEIRAQPATVTTLSQKRSWLFQTYAPVFLIDDDCTQMLNLAAAPGEPSRVPDQDVEAIVQATYRTAWQLGVRMFTFNPFMRPLGYPEHRPFTLTGVPTLHAAGLLPADDLWFRHDLPILSDVWIGLLNAYVHRWLFEDRRYHVLHPGTMTNPGGLADTRTEAMLVHAYDELRDAFGSAVQPARGQGTDDAFAAGLLTVRLPF